ncbi:MAG: prepilin-type N-terminal cleavage/methylation domain-containing protein [Candidatus Hydrogenedentes bacterium]|nr:prepilin-type N-terminal cleavage/methylation domain-containing protein [Candidatus Hydrogenedentota bacterium]
MPCVAGSMLRTPHSALRASPGFTLMEIMVTLAILGVGLFVVLNGFFSSLRLRDTAIDASIRKELIQRAVGIAETQVLAGTLSEAGDFGTRYPDYTWNYDAVLGAGDDGLVQLYEVEVTVTGPEDEDTLSFLVYNTTVEEDTPNGGSGGRGILSGNNNNRSRNTGNASTTNRTRNTSSTTRPGSTR